MVLELLNPKKSKAPLDHCQDFYILRPFQEYAVKDLASKSPCFLHRLICDRDYRKAIWRHFAGKTSFPKSHWQQNSFCQKFHHRVPLNNGIRRHQLKSRASHHLVTTDGVIPAEASLNLAKSNVQDYHHNVQRHSLYYTADRYRYT